MIKFGNYVKNLFDFIEIQSESNIIKFFNQDSLSDIITYGLFPLVMVNNELRILKNKYYMNAYFPIKYLGMVQLVDNSYVYATFSTPQSANKFRNKYKTITTTMYTTLCELKLAQPLINESNSPIKIYR